MKYLSSLLAAASLTAFAAACDCARVSEAIDPSRPDTTAYNYEVCIDATDTAGIIPNIVSNINVWNMGEMFINPSVKSEYNIFDFVEYVQLMTATGGEPSRDLFKDPSDNSVLDDYDFDRLIQNCRGILSLGARPHIKFGNVPGKFTKGYDVGSFHVNVYAPQDYRQYYKYIRAIVEALVGEFGKDEVLSWHYGVLTEYENRSWFRGTDGSPDNAAEEYCKLYDWTVQALIDVLGQDGLYVGAHSMTNIEGLWDERIFIRHCAEGTNWANGGKGSYLSYLSASSYETPGEITYGYGPEQCISFLKEAAESCGLKNLVYGIDEGRIYGSSQGSLKSELHSRTVGQTFMAGYDARLYTRMIEIGCSYVSSWQYLTKNIFEGNPSIAYHVASNVAAFAGMNRAAVSCTATDAVRDAEIGALSGVDPSTGRTAVMVYNYSNNLEYADTATVKLTIKTPLGRGCHPICIRKVSDECNYFDEWIQDRKKLGITDDMFLWSPDDGCCVTKYLMDSAAVAKFEELDATRYAELSRLVPVTGNIKVSKDGTVALRCKLGGNNVWFVEIR